MTFQRKNYLIKQFKKQEENLLEKISKFPELSKVRCIVMIVEIKNYDNVFATYDYVKKRFVNIFVMEEEINL